MSALEEKDICDVMTATRVLRFHSQRRATTDSSSCRSTTSRCSSATRKTCSSSSSLARSISKEERAKLKVAQLKEKQHLLQIQAEKMRQRELEEAELKRQREFEEAECKHQLDREEAERKHQQELKEAELRWRREQEEADFKLQMEILDASHAEQAATVHRQVMEAKLANGGSAVVDDLLPGRLELAGLQINVATTSGTVARNEVPVVKDYESSSTSFEVPTAPFVKRVTTAPDDNRASPIEKKAQLPRTKLVDFDDLPNRNVLRRDVSPGILKTDDLLQRNQTLPKFPVLDAAGSSFKPKDDGILTVTNLMKDCMKKPNLEPFKFNGDPTKYLRFMSTFETTTESMEDDNRRKLLYLIQHCGEKVKPLIENCLMLEPKRGYAKAKEVLHDTYGKKNVIARAYVKRLMEGPNIRHDDSKALTNFVREIEECLVPLTHLNYFSDLNSFENIATIVRRLPSSLHTRWTRFSSNIERQGCEPSFSIFIRLFLMRQKWLNRLMQLLSSKRVKKVRV